MDLDDPATWEARAFDALQVDPDDIDLKRLARALRDLSQRHETSAPLTGRLGPGQEDDAATLLVRLLIFARRSYRAGRHLLQTVPLLRGYRHVLERGAGFGPFLLSFAPSACTLEAEEAFSEYASPRQRLLASIPSPSPSSQDGPPLEVFGYSFAEMSGFDTDRGCELILSTLQRGRDVLVVEPGDRRHSRQLMEVRDRLAGEELFPAAPCPAVPQCPLRAHEKDWCHFTIPCAPGPIAESLAGVAGRDVHRAHFSYLLYTSRREAAAVASRLLRAFSEGKQKARAVVCSEQGLLQLTTLKRHRAAFEHFRALVPNIPVQLAEDLPLRGDGLRVNDPRQLLPVSSPEPPRPGDPSSA